MGHELAVSVLLLGQCQPMVLTQPAPDESVTNHRTQVIVRPLWVLTALCSCHSKREN